VLQNAACRRDLARPPFDWNSLPPAAAVSPEIKSWVRSRDIAYAKARQNGRAA
jgi:hypothetical protein